MVEFSKPTPGYLDDIAAHMRSEDRQEIGLSNPDMTAREVLEMSCHVFPDKAYVAIADGVPVCAFGVQRSNQLCPVGTIWLLGTGRMGRIAFARQSRKMLPKLFGTDIDVLTNFVWSKYGAAVRWLEWLGARFLDSPVSSGREFVQFELLRSDIIVEA